MFTEEKRVEMDLEGLWDIRNTRRARKGEKANAAAEAAIRMLQQEDDQTQSIPEGNNDLWEETDSVDDGIGERSERSGETKIK